MSEARNGEVKCAASSNTSCLQAITASADQNQDLANEKSCSPIASLIAGKACIKSKSASNKGAQGNLPSRRGGQSSGNVVTNPTAPMHGAILSRYALYSPSRPSKLSQECSVAGEGVPAVADLCGERVQNGQHIQRNSKPYSTYGHNDDETCPYFADSEVFLGYSQSDERAKALQNNANCWQTEHALWPSSPIGPYDVLLSGSSPATSIARPHSYIAPSPSSTESPNLSYYNSSAPKFPAIPSYLTIPYVLPPLGDSFQRCSTQMDPVNLGLSQLVSPQTTINIDHDLPLANVGIATTAPYDWSSSSLAQPVQQSTKRKISASKKRPRVFDLLQGDSSMRVLASDPEAFKAFAKSTSTSADQQHVNLLFDAMNDMSATEDNDGMVRGWNKLRIGKAAKLRRVCEDLLITIKRAIALDDEPLSDHKKSSNQYPTFAARFEAIQDTLRTQKTVCKHLLEDPYMYQVVDDPIYASMRVSNNRRVNRGKKDAIEQGRKILGVKGNGKGRPLTKDDSSEVLDGEGDFDDYEEEQAVEERLQRSTSGIVPTLRNRSLLKKPSYVDHSQGVLESIEDDSYRSSKKFKRRGPVNNQLQNSDTVKNPLDIAGNQSEQMEAGKTEQELWFSLDVPNEGNSNELSHSDPILNQPLSSYFSLEENEKIAFSSFENSSFGTDYGNTPAIPSQDLAAPAAGSAQPFTSPQMAYPLPYDDSKFGDPDNFIDSMSGTDLYSDPVTDDTNIPEGFDAPAWYNDYLENTPQQ